MRDKHLIICLDAGMNLGHCGFIEGYLLSYGTVLTPKGKYPSTQKRLYVQFQEILKLLKEYKELAREHLNATRCKVVVVTEDVTQSFANTKFRSKHNWLVVASYSAIFIACGKLGIPVLTYAPTTIKKAFCGSGKAKKEEMEKYFHEESDYKHLGAVGSHVIDSLAIYATFRKDVEAGKIEIT